MSLCALEEGVAPTWRWKGLQPRHPAEGHHTFTPQQPQARGRLLLRGLGDDGEIWTKYTATSFLRPRCIYHLISIACACVCFNVSYLPLTPPHSHHLSSSVLRLFDLISFSLCAKFRPAWRTKKRKPNKLTKCWFFSQGGSPGYPWRSYSTSSLHIGCFSIYFKLTFVYLKIKKNPMKRMPLKGGIREIQPRTLCRHSLECPLLRLRTRKWGISRGAESKPVTSRGSPHRSR